MSTKHEQILKYIENLEVGHRISVRQIAKTLNVSEGTAYRAIKEAENQGYVSTIERVGTIRIEKKHKGNIEKLTFAEVVNIVDGQVLGGREGLHKTLNRFFIGAMRLEDMMRYVEAGGLLIVGNRDKAHVYGLQAGAAVLITGGFDASDVVKRLADELSLPVISTTYDTFTTAAMINRAIYDQLIKKEIVHVADIFIPFERTNVLTLGDSIRDFRKLNEETGHSRYPVIDDRNRVQGMITAKDIIGHNDEVPIEKVMTKDPITTGMTTSLASCAHMMIWEGIECLPVVDDAKRLLGIITRQDVLKALQMMQRQPQVGETIDDLITAHLTEMDDDRFSFKVMPQMTNHLGVLSQGVVTTVVITAAIRLLRKQKKGDLVIENVTLYFIKPIQIESIVEIQPKVLDATRRYGKVDVEIFYNGQAVGKAFVLAQFIDRY